MYYQDVFEVKLQDSKPLAAFLVAMTAVFLLFNISMWMRSTAIPPPPVEEVVEYDYRTDKTYREAIPQLKKSSYSVIAKKDIFTVKDVKATAPVKKALSASAARNAPRLKLLGTVIVYEDEGALMSQPGQAAEYYRTGDEIDGYEVVEIGRNFVMLAGVGGTMEVSLSDINKGNSNNTRYI